MPHFLEKRDRWGHGRAVWVLALMVAVFPAAIWSLRQVEMHNDVTTWLPSKDPQSQTLKWYQSTFPSDDRILVSWPGSGLNDPRLEEFAVRLSGVEDKNGVPQGGSPYIKDVLTPQSVLARMTRRGVLIDDAVTRLEGLLLGRGPLKIELTEAGRQRGRFFVEELQAIAHDEIGIEVAVIDLSDDSDYIKPTQPQPDAPEPLEGLEGYLNAEPISDLALTWPGIHSNEKSVERFIQLALARRGAPSESEPSGQLLVKECFFYSGSPAAIAVSLSEAGIEDRAEAIAAIRSAAEASGIAPTAIHLGGRLVAGNELNQAVKRAGWNEAFPMFDFARRSPILFSFLITVIFSFLLLRSIRLALLVLIVSLYTVIISVALVPVSGGSMNMVLIVMPTLLMVLTTSAAIHLANYWRHAAGQGVENSVLEAARMAARPCILASVTTAIGLMSLVTSTLVPVRDFGIYSAIGCVISLFVVLYGLPSMMLYWKSRSPKEAEVRGQSWLTLGRWISRFNAAVVSVCLVFGVICTYGLVWFRTETKVIRYFPEESRIVQDYRFLEENLSGIVSVDTVVRFDHDGQNQLNFLERMELVRRIQTRMRAHQNISGVISLASFQPVEKRPPKSASFLQKGRYNAKANRMADKIHEALGKETTTGKSHVFSSMLALETHPGVKPDEKPDELWRISAQCSIMTDVDYGELTADLDRIARSELKTVGSPGTNHVVTGLVPLFLRTQQAVLESLIRSFGLAFGVIAIVMMFLLRNPLAGLITMIPNLLPVSVVFGLISWAGLRIDIGTMITASVALGIAVDGTLHLLTWFRRGIEEGQSRASAVARSLEHCGPAMLQTSAAIGLGMLMLMPVELLLISRFGWLMASLIGMALLADVILLPALLAGPLGRLIERTTRPDRDTIDGDSESGNDSITVHSEEAPARPKVAVDATAKSIRHRAG